MNTERFEALIDAVIAIIITMIVLEIPLAPLGTWESLFEYRMEFITYAVSFITCFSFWNYHQNIFSIVNKINYKILWTDGVSLLVLSFLPYLTTLVANNFYSITAQALYGLDYIIITTINILSGIILKSTDKGNIALQISLDIKTVSIITYTIIGIGYIVGFMVYPPAIMISCILAMFLTQPIRRLIEKIKT